MKQRILDVEKRKGMRDDSGAAIFAALGLLVVFSLLGTAYIEFSRITFEETRLDVQKVRSSHLSRGGIYAGIGEIQAALAKGIEPNQNYEVKLPIYRILDGEVEDFEQNVTISVQDEASKANLNHAPKKVLVALGIPAEVVDAYRKNATSKDGRVLVSFDDLRTRDFMNGQNFNALNESLFTAHSGDSEGTGNAINLNTADPTILAAVFAIDVEEAQSLAAKRPFTSWADVRSKVGREPSTFNVYDGGTSNNAMPRSLSLTSRSFRLISEASMVNAYTTKNGLHSGIEAVVNFTADGSFSIRFWNENEITEYENVDLVADNAADVGTDEVTETENASVDVDVDTE
ncbi:general secretion pathway protein GspK [bacterium AH-315-P07]|nr:general secretion pathway protein GspK [bacterium AH-315-P07]